MNTPVPLAGHSASLAPRKLSDHTLQLRCVEAAPTLNSRPFLGADNVSQPKASAKLIHPPWPIAVLATEAGVEITNCLELVPPRS
ncbi:MAG TPA: hypothetical protein VGM94_01685 [Galbitalea sp.]